MPSSTSDRLAGSRAPRPEGREGHRPPAKKIPRIIFRGGVTCVTCVTCHACAPLARGRDMRDMSVTCHGCHACAPRRQRDKRDTTLWGVTHVTLRRPLLGELFKAPPDLANSIIRRCPVRCRRVAVVSCRITRTALHLPAHRCQPTADCGLRVAIYVDDRLSNCEAVGTRSPGTLASPTTRAGTQRLGNRLLLKIKNLKIKSRLAARLRARQFTKGFKPWQTPNRKPALSPQR
jgi:hypothetical protein